MSINVQENLLKSKHVIMLKNILNVTGVKKLNKKDQKALQGGIGDGYCYMSFEDCCCYFEDRRDFICAPGKRQLNSCVYI